MLPLPRVPDRVVGGDLDVLVDIGLADAKADWFAPLDISAWHGKKLTIAAGRLPADSEALANIDQLQLPDRHGLLSTAISFKRFPPGEGRGEGLPLWQKPLAIHAIALHKRFIHLDPKTRGFG